MMQAWSTNSVTREIRTDYLRKALDVTFCMTEVEFAVKDYSNSSDLRNVDLGHVNVLEFVGRGPQGAKRSLRHIRADQADNYIIYLPRSAVIHMEQNGRRSVINPGSFLIVQTGKPFEGLIHDTENNGEDYISHHVRVPASLLRERIPSLDSHCNRVFQLSAGTCNLMSGLIDSIIREGAQLDPSHLKNIKSALVDLISSSFSEKIKNIEQGPTRTENSRELSRQKILDFIEANLSCPSLNTQMISEGCAISVRYLHAIFESTEWTVGGWIREQRLQRCRKSLLDPALKSQSVTEIALSWGFNDPAYFSRLYRARFGVAPSTERK